MRTKAYSDQIVRKTERFPVPPVQACGFGKKLDHVTTVSESFANRLVLPVMGLTP